MILKTPVSKVLGIGYGFSKRLEKLGILTVEDLLLHYPFRYDDFSNVSNLLEAQIGEKVTLIGEIWSIRNIITKTRKTLTQAVFNDGNSAIDLTWFNSPYLIKSIKVGDRIQISGKITKFHSKYSIIMPVWEKTEKLSIALNEKTKDGSLHTGRLVPVYPETEGLTSKWLRQKIALILPEAVKEFEDPLSEQIREGMYSLPDAIQKIHFPENLDEAKKAKERLSFDELFFIQLVTQKVKQEWQNKPSVKPLLIDDIKVGDFTKNLPFELTNAQKRVIEEIMEDLKKTKPMNRLVQGEVGSGKTAVAAVIAYMAYLNGFKTLFMAPTEILAFQHFATFSNLLEKKGLKIGIYTGSRKKTGDLPDIVIGTHALLSQKLDLENIGLIVVDEQQRFGVEQRTILRSKAKIPHFMTMTATPIPRTVALTMYGDLDLSIIDELPKKRQKIKTYVVPKKKREDAYKFIQKQVEEGGQCYIITPLIELSETIQSAKAAIFEFERLKREIFPKLKLGLLHGRLKAKEKEEVLGQFKEGKTDILVSTSVVEVGVDVPNATVMLIENAERFGLAQLHQLRGRVGRGVKQSYCLLFSGVEEPSAYSRLKSLEKTENGLELAELDMKIRGSGQIFGKMQSGRFELKLASLYDLPLVEKTRNVALKLLSEDNELENHREIKKKLETMSAHVMPD